MGVLIHENFRLYFWFLRFCKQIDRPLSELPPSLSIPTRLKVWSNLKHCSRFCWILIVRFCWLPTELKSQLCWKQWKPQTKAHLVSGMCSIWSKFLRREIFFCIKKHQNLTWKSQLPKRYLFGSKNREKGWCQPGWVLSKSHVPGIWKERHKIIWYFTKIPKDFHLTIYV